MHSKYNLAQNARGIWEIRWTEQDESGRSRSHRTSTRANDHTAAQAYLRVWARTREEALETLTEPTLGTFIEGYLEGARERGVRASQSYALRPIKKALGDLQVRDLGEGALDDYRRKRLAEVKSGTVRRELGALRSVLGWALKNRKNRLKAEDLPHIQLPENGQPRELWMDEAQEEDFHKRALAWPRTRVGMYVAIGLNTGARKEAIQQLRWDQVDLEAGFIDFRKRAGARVTKKRRVATPINDRLREVLEAVPESLRWGRVIGNGDVRGAYGTFVKSTASPWVGSHVMRHTYITLALRAGTSIWDVAQLVGDTPEVISKHYGHHQADWHLKEAANKRFKKSA